MKRLVMIMLAASAMAPASALAQGRTAAPPIKWEDTPRAQMRMPAGAPPAMHHAPAPGAMRHGPAHAGPKPPMMKHDGAKPMHMRHSDRVLARHHQRGPHGMRRHHGVKNYSKYHRIDRGYALPHSWWGPQFQIHNWSMYGLPQPSYGSRWVRYYDDALMVDGYGRVVDGRWGMGWDRWEDQWAYDQRGIPVYVGDGDYYPGDEDYAWVEGESRGYADGYGYGHQGGYAHGGPCAQACAPMPPLPPGYAYPHGYGWGWGYGYGAGMVVTETTVTTSPTIVEETWVEEEVVHERRAKPRKYRAKPRYHRPKPLPGERG